MLRERQARSEMQLQPLVSPKWAASRRGAFLHNAASGILQQQQEQQRVVAERVVARYAAQNAGNEDSGGEGQLLTLEQLEQGLSNGAIRGANAQPPGRGSAALLGSKRGREVTDGCGDLGTQGHSRLGDTVVSANGHLGRRLLDQSTGAATEHWF